MSPRQAERHGAAHASRSGPASQRRRIVASKLAAPPRRPGIVDRPVLVDGLVSATHAPVVLVSAPAGYGKTTLLALWREADERPFAWSPWRPPTTTRWRSSPGCSPHWIRSWTATPRSATA
jgi:LuxR family maltose regulon positive regulatory protein